VYYSIETLEGNGAELGFPTLVLALIAALVAFSLRELCAQLARFVHAIVRELVALLSARPCAVAQPAPQSHPLRAQTILAARRLGRAPPNERCLSSSTSRRSGPPRAFTVAKSRTKRPCAAHASQSISHEASTPNGPQRETAARAICATGLNRT
jgi:hypothetical protein